MLSCKKQYYLFLETTLGISIQSQNEENSEFLHKAHDMLDITARRFFQPWIQPAFLFRLSKYAKPFYSSVDFLNKRLADVSTAYLLVRLKFVWLVLTKVPRN